MKTISMLTLAIALAPVAAFAQSFNEQDVVNDLNAMRAAAQASESKATWLQPSNRKEKCAVVFSGSEVPTSAKWYGSCANGKASGLGIAIAQSADRKVVAVEEYRGHTLADVFTYRQVDVGPKGTSIFEGVYNGARSAAKVTQVARTPNGNTNMEELRRSCDAGVCVGQQTDLTGSVGYMVTGNSGYQLRSMEFRADDTPVFTRMQVVINGIVRAESVVLDGVKHDFGAVVQTGATVPASFGALNPIIHSPYAQYIEASSGIDSALEESEAKVAAVKTRFCAKPSNEDIARICDLTLIKPSNTDLLAARGELNQAVMQNGLALRRNRDAANAQVAQQAAQLAQMQANYAAQQAQIDAMRRQQNQQALMQGINALNQVGINAQQMGQQLQQTIQMPQVQMPTPPGRSGVICRTVGNTVFCD